MSPLFSGESYIDRETVLDIVVNIIPMGILLAFVLLFLLFNPFGQDIPTSLIAHFLTIFPFVLLGILTYLSARVISRDQKAESAGEE